MDRPTTATPRTLDDSWSSGDAYDAYIGRWSRLVAVEFLRWLEMPAGLEWLDLGCGTGALTEAILARCAPRSVVGIDPSPEFVAHARARVHDGRASFAVGSAERTGLERDTVDVVVSGLVLNFVPDIRAALAEARRVASAGGTIAGYVWDYADGMELLRRFWDAAVALHPAAAALDEAVRFQLAGGAPLREAFVDAGLSAVEVRTIAVPTVFAGFDDVWAPFLAGTGPAPAFVTTLPESRRADLRELLRSMLPAAADGSIHLVAGAWAVRGTSS